MSAGEATVPRALTVVLVHNRYQQPGGEDTAVDADYELLTARGHHVVRYERQNDDIESMGVVGRTRLAAGTVWSVSGARGLGRVLQEARADVVHVHNTFPMLSPSVYSAAARQGIPVVQTVHNYRMVCAAATCSRDGHTCRECLGRALPWPALRYACYRDSRPQTAVVTAMQVAHRAVHTWKRRVALYLPVSEYTARMLMAAGALPGDRVMVRYNFCAQDPGERDRATDAGHVLFAGRLVPEKGIEVLVRAAALVPTVRVLVAGDGPARRAAEQLTAQLGATNITFLGQLTHTALIRELATARCLVFPSIWDEPLPMVLVEAAALGVPAVASAVGGVPEIVSEHSGELLPPGDVEALAAVLATVDDREGWQAKGSEARHRFEEAFTGDRSYERLMLAYRRAGVRVLVERAR